MNKIYFYLPGILATHELNLMVHDRLRNCPSHFYPNIDIGAIFGSFPGYIWNGGRLMKGEISTNIIDILMKDYADRNIPIRWTWTNPTLTLEDLDDLQCNRLTKKYENGTNEILVNNDLTEQFFRENYPEYPLISSTTKRLTDINDLNAELKKDYKLVVIDYDFNNDWSLLEKIEDPSRCEILINPLCNPKCPFRKDHYQLIGKIQRGHYEENDKNVEKCPAQYRKFSTIKKLPTFISVEDLYNKYVPAGFRHFKIEGRGVCPLEPMNWYLYYMVKPEFYEEERDWFQIAINDTWMHPKI